MPELQRLRADHLEALRDVELENRAWFAASVTDRGDAFFAHLEDHVAALVAAQEEGAGAFYVLVDDDGSILGRFNLELDGDGVAGLGYRVAERVAGRGVATTTVVALCRLARARHGVRVVRAAAAHANPASRRVLEKAGFTEVGPADPASLGGKPGTWFELVLAPEDAR